MKNKKTNSMPKQDIKERSKKAKKDKVRENPSSHPGDATALPPVPGVDSLPAHHARGGADPLVSTGSDLPPHQLDPSNNFSLPEILSGRTGRAGEENDDDDSEAAMSDGAGGGGADSGAALQPLPPSTSIAALHAKLQERIASLQGKRFDKPVDAGYPNRSLAAASSSATAGAGAVPPEPGSKEELLAEARKRRGELRDNRRNARKEERRKEAAGKAKPAAATAAGDKKKKAAEGELSVRPGKVRSAPPPPPLPLTVVDKLTPLSAWALFRTVRQTTLLVPELKTAAPGANVSFSQFKLPSTFGASTSTSAKRSKPLPSNPTQALSVLEAQKAKLAELPDEVRTEKAEQARWSKALERAEGGKVRDDAGRLKKAAKRKEKEKAKSSTEWCVLLGSPAGSARVRTHARTHAFAHSPPFRFLRRSRGS